MSTHSIGSRGGKMTGTKFHLERDWLLEQLDANDQLKKFFASENLSDLLSEDGVSSSEGVRLPYGVRPVQNSRRWKKAPI